MKLKLKIKILTFLLVGSVLSSCLDGDLMNTPPDASGAILQMTFNASGSTLVNSGLRYFGNQALLYPPTHANDTATYAVTIQGVESLSRDIVVTLATPTDALDDYYYADSIDYLMMPDSLYDFISTTATIEAGKTYAEFKVVFHPNKVDLLQNYMLPVTATNNANLPMSANYGFVYFHAIGNPIAGLYTQNWTRWNNATGAGAPTFTDTDDAAIFAPSNGTIITVPSLTGVTYVVQFDDDGNGNLSNFKVSFDAKSVTDSGITITDGPTVALADPIAGKYEFHFGYLNSSGAARVIWDSFTKN